MSALVLTVQLGRVGEPATPAVTPRICRVVAVLIGRLQTPLLSGKRDRHGAGGSCGAGDGAVLEALGQQDGWRGGDGEDGGDLGEGDRDGVAGAEGAGGWR